MSHSPPVVVITGASSGIGRATAHAFAARGYAVALAARRASLLDQVEFECRQLGGEAVAVPTDVTREEDVEALARKALMRFGKIDVWFNNAGVGVFGKLEEIPNDAWRRVIETNLFGYLYGAKAALRWFKHQGHGVLINNASLVSRIGQPDATAYVASKFAVRGFSEALRQELLDWPEIQVCTVLPSVIDTPFFQHAANFSGRRVRAAPPVYAPEQVAETVVGLVTRPRAEVIVGTAGKLGALQQRLAPNLTRRVVGRAMYRGILAPEPSPATGGALFQPMAEGDTVEGGWRQPSEARAVPTVAMVVGLLAVPAGFLALRRLRQEG